MRRSNRSFGVQLALFVLRLVFGIIFLAHGVQKIMTLSGVTLFFARLGIPLPEVAAPAIALLEVVGGVILILGLGWVTRLVTLLLSISMLAAILMAKQGKGLVGGFEFELALLAVMVALTLTGPGRIALMREKTPGDLTRREPAADASL